MITTLGCASLLAMTVTAGVRTQVSPEPTAAPQVRASKPAPAAEAKRATPAELTPAMLAKPMPKKKSKKAAAESPAAGLLTKVQKYYSSIEDYRADFIQSYTKVALSRTTESRGVLMLKKPSFMRWSYTQPVEKLWVVDGDTLYVVDPEFEQVFVDKNFKTEELQSSISFLWGRGRLDESFNAKVGDPKKYGADKGHAVLELTPKRGATYTKLVLVVDTTSGAVTESIIFETAGNTNHFKFRNPKHNTKLGKELFEYDPPENYEIIHR